MHAAESSTSPAGRCIDGLTQATGLTISSLVNSGCPTKCRASSPRPVAGLSLVDTKPLRRDELDYALKMLLYLTVRDAHVVHGRSYGEVPSNFISLGERKRE